MVDEFKLGLFNSARMWFVISFHKEISTPIHHPVKTRRWRNRLCSGANFELPAFVVFDSIHDPFTHFLLEDLVLLGDHLTLSAQ